MGFQISEDFPALSSLTYPEGFSFTISGILGRIWWGSFSLARFDHYRQLMFRFAKTQKTYFKAGLFYFLSALFSTSSGTLHWLLLKRISVIVPIMTAVAVFIFYQAYRTHPRLIERFVNPKPETTASRSFLICPKLHFGILNSEELMLKFYRWNQSLHYCLVSCPRVVLKCLL